MAFYVAVSLLDSFMHASHHM